MQPVMLKLGTVRNHVEYPLSNIQLLSRRAKYNPGSRRYMFGTNDL